MEGCGEMEGGSERSRERGRDRALRDQRERESEMKGEAGDGWREGDGQIEERVGDSQW